MSATPEDRRTIDPRRAQQEGGAVHGSDGTNSHLTPEIWLPRHGQLEDGPDCMLGDLAPLLELDHQAGLSFAALAGAQEERPTPKQELLQATLSDAEAP